MAATMAAATDLTNVAAPLVFTCVVMGVDALMLRIGSIRDGLGLGFGFVVTG